MIKSYQICERSSTIIIAPLPPWSLLPLPSWHHPCFHYDNDGSDNGHGFGCNNGHLSSGDDSDGGMG